MMASVKKRVRKEWRRWRYSIRASIFRIYAKIKHPAFVWYLLNIPYVVRFRRNLPQLNETQKKIVSDLNTEGISITSISELFPEEDKLTVLQAYVNKRGGRCRKNHKKDFLVDYLSEIPELGFENPFFGLAVDPRILNIVNTYLGMWSKLFHFMVRKTEIAKKDTVPRLSQCWHRTSQEKKVCKVYIYLNDVTKESGPFEYIPQSKPGGKWGGVFPQKLLGSKFLSKQEIDDHIPTTHHYVVTGKAGTVIFADTTGLHRGGYSTQKNRIMSTFAYGAPTYRENIHYSFTKKLLGELKEKRYPLQSLCALKSKWLRKSH